MRKAAIVKKVDELGRIVLPEELRRQLDIAKDDPLEICVDGNNIVLQKHKDACIFCREAGALQSFKNHKLCESCIAAICSSEMAWHK